LSKALNIRDKPRINLDNPSMRTIMTRSAQKKQITEPQPITKRPISKVSKATDAASKATMRVTRKQSATSSAE